MTKAYALKKPVQPELPGMPDRDELGKRAIEYLEIRDEIRRLKDVEKMVSEELKKQFVLAKKTQLIVDRKIIRYEYARKETIKVEKI